MFKLNNGNIKVTYDICSKLTLVTPEPTMLLFLLFILNIVYTLFWYFHCWLWRSKCWPARKATVMITFAAFFEKWPFYLSHCFEGKHYVEVSVFGVFLVYIFPHSDQKNFEYGVFMQWSVFTFCQHFIYLIS